MATLATYFRRPEMMVYAETQAPTHAAAVRVEASPYVLRSLPYEDVFFFSKKIDNSRVVKEADPRARGACWSHHWRRLPARHADAQRPCPQCSPDPRRL